MTPSHKTQQCDRAVKSQTAAKRERTQVTPLAKRKSSKEFMGPGMQHSKNQVPSKNST